MGLIRFLYYLYQIPLSWFKTPHVKSVMQERVFHENKEFKLILQTFSTINIRHIKLQFDEFEVFIVPDKGRKLRQVS